MNVVCAIGAWWGADVAQRLYDTTDCLWTYVFFPEHLSVSAVEGARYVLCLNWSQRIGDELLGASEFVNFHASRLPEGRGGAPIENQILLGRPDTVITAHRMTSRLDAGPIYGTRGPVSLAGTKQDIQRRFIEPVAELARWIVETEPEPVPQVGKPTYFRRLSSQRYRALWASREQAA